MQFVQELSGLTIKRSKTGYISGQGVSVMLVEADNGNVSETLRYNQRVWKGMVFMGQETSYVGPLLFEQLWKSVIPFTLGQTLPTGGLLTPKLTTEMYDNPYLQQNPPESCDSEPSNERPPIEERTPSTGKGRKRAASTTASGKAKRRCLPKQKMFGCTPKEMKAMKEKAVEKNNKEIFIRGFLDYKGEKLTDKSALLEDIVPPPPQLEDEYTTIEDETIGSFAISQQEYNNITAQLALEDERRVYEEGLELDIHNSVVIEFF